MSLKIKSGKYYRTRDGRKVGPLAETEAGQFVLSDGVRFWGEDGFEIGGRTDGRGDLIAEWTDEPAHIIHSTNGSTYDLTALETPFGLLPDDVQDALRAWSHGIEFFNCDEWEGVSGINGKSFTYRAKPAPQPKEWVLYWEASFDAKNYKRPCDTHRITIRDDGRGNHTADVEALE